MIRQGATRNAYAAYIARYGAQQNHGHHNAQEDHDNQGVNETEPVNTWIKYMKITVPAGSLNLFERPPQSKTGEVDLPRVYPIPKRGALVFVNRKYRLVSVGLRSKSRDSYT